MTVFYVLWSEHVISKYLMEQINSGIQKKPPFYSKILSCPCLGMSTKWCIKIFLPWINEQGLWEQNDSSSGGRSSCGPLALGVCQARAVDSENPNENTDKNIMDWYSAIKRNELPIHPMIWMNLTDILSRRQTFIKEYILCGFLYLKL